MAVVMVQGRFHTTMVKRKKYLYWDVNQTDSTTRTANCAATTVRMLSATNIGRGTLASALNCSMCRPLIISTNILGGARDMGEHVVMGAHDCDRQSNLDQ